jgi:hypothetical protein
MAVFTMGKEISTKAPTISFDVDPMKPLAKGPHVFQLVVRDDDGLLSQPMQVTVVVADDRMPTAVLSAPSTVQISESFILDGSKSMDPFPGMIVEYIWTWMQ